MVWQTTMNVSLCPAIVLYVHDLAIGDNLHILYLITLHCMSNKSF